MAQDRKLPAGWQALTEQELAVFAKAYLALSEQLSRTEAPPAEQVRRRFVRWIFQAGLETGTADLDLLDHFSSHGEAALHGAEAAPERDRE